MQPAVSDSTSVSQGTNRGLFLAVAILSLAGAVVSAISLQRHYAKSATEFCDFSQKFSCDIVNRSEYSSLAGIPVAGIGLAGYLALMSLSTLWRSRFETPVRLLAASGAGLAFALYLTYIEAYRLETWCILCLTSLLLIFLITVLAISIKLKNANA
jgi:vitamin-K-epoxide reductase (warfarin-sensitive)